MSALKSLTLLMFSWLCLTAGPAFGTATIYMFDEMGHMMTISDGDANDSNSASGQVSYSGLLGPAGSNWMVDVATGTSGSPLPFLRLSGQDTSGGQGVLTIVFGDTDFWMGPGHTVDTMSAHIGGSTGGNVAWQMGFDDNDQLFGAGGKTPTFGAGVTGSAYQGNLAMPLDVNGNFSMWLGVQITHGGSATTTFDIVGAVPEPGSLALIGIALLGGVVVTRRARRR